MSLSCALSFHLGGVKKNFSKSQSMAICFPFGVLILCKNQQGKDSALILLILITVLWF